MVWNAPGVGLLCASLLIFGLAIYLYWKYNQSEEPMITPWWAYLFLGSGYLFYVVIIYLWLSNTLIGWTQQDELLLLGIAMAYHVFVGAFSFRYKSIVFWGATLIVLQGLLGIIFFFIQDFGAI